MRGRRGVAAIAALLCVAAGAIAGNSPADAGDATTIDVDSGEVSITANGKCSLAEAITNVSGLNRTWVDCPTGAGVSTIHVTAGTYALTALLPFISQTIAIKGDGADTTIIDGAGSYRIFNAQGGGSLTIDGLTLRNGKGALGGAIYAYNAADSMALTVRNSSFESNKATADGAAIYLSGASLTVTGSSFTGNVATKNGGAIGLPGGDTVVKVANSTFVSNTALYGGVVAAKNAGYDDPVTILNSTLVGNDATTANTGLASNINTIVVANSIIAKGGALNATCETGADAFATGSGHNLTDDASCTTRFFSLATSLDLGTAGPHGGTTSNFEPPTGSTAIDAGDDAICAGSLVNGVDQRGETRVAQGTHCDIGAIELQVTTEEPEGALITATKTVAGDLAPGGQITYTIVLANSGDGTQADNAGHEFKDVLPAGVALVSAAASSGVAVADAATGTVTWDGEIPAAGQAIIFIHATVAGVIRDVVSNQASVSYDADGDGSNDAAGVSDDPSTEAPGDATEFIVTAPDIRVTKTVTTEGPYHPGMTIGYRVEVSNAGNATATGAVLEDHLDANTILDTDSVSTTSGAIDDGTDASSLVVQLADIPAGESAVVTFDATTKKPVPAGTTDVENQATVTGTNFDAVLSDDDGDASNGIDPTVSLVQTSPSLGLEMGGSPTTAPGEVMIYDLDYENTGDIGLDHVVIAADVPVGSDFNAATSTTGWLCGTAGGHPICTLDLGTLSGGATGTASFAVTVDGDVTSDALSFGAGISSGDVSAATSANTTILRPDISAAITGPSTANPSGFVHYELKVTNTGGFEAKDVVVRSALPSGLTFSGSSECTASGQAVTCNAGDLDAGGGTATMTIYADVASYLLDQSTLSLSASVTWALGLAPVESNTFVTTIEGINLSAFVEGTAEGAPGSTVVLQVIYANLGSATATGVWIEASLPSGVTMAPELSPGWECTGSDCYLPFGTLAAGSGSTPFGFNIGAIADDLQAVGVRLAIGDDGGHGPEGHSADNITVALITVIRPDLTVTLSAPATTTPGGTFTYSATVTNAGQAAAAATTLTLVLPAGLTFNAATSSVGCGAVDGAVSCPVPALAVGGSETVTIGVVVSDAMLDAAALTGHVVAGAVLGEAAVANNNSDDVTTVVHAANLGVTATGGGTVRPGAAIAYAFEAGNAGSLAAEDVVLSVRLADGIAFSVAGSSAGCIAEGQDVTCASAGAGAMSSFTVAGVVSSALPDGRALVSHATVRSSTPESTATLGDNAGEVTTTVSYLLDIRPALVAPATATTEAALSFGITLTNAGDDATAEFVVNVPVGVVVDSVAAGGALVCRGLEDDGRSFACSGEIAAGSAPTVVFAAHLDGLALDQLLAFGVEGRAFTGEGASPVQEQRFAATASISAVRTTTVTVGASASPRVVMPGAEARFTASVANPGDGLEGAELRIALPEGVEFARATVEGGLSCTPAQTVVCSPLNGGFAAGATASIIVVVRLSPGAVAGSSLTADVTLRHTGGAVRASASVSVAMPPPDFVVPLPPTTDPQPATYTYNLTFRWTLITWVGADGATPEDALRGDQAAAFVRAIYTFDPVAGAWRGYFGQSVPVEGANDLTVLEVGRVYWVAIDGAAEAEWTVPLGGASG